MLDGIWMASPCELRLDSKDTSKGLHIRGLLTNSRKKPTGWVLQLRPPSAGRKNHAEPGSDQQQSLKLEREIVP
jgi:hypothetical protein